MHPQLSIIIPHFNDVENLVKCVRMLKAQSLAPATFEIVVADNNSPVGIDVVRQAVDGDATVVEAPVQGAGPARNAAVAASIGSVLAFIDSDCRPQRDWLERGLAALGKADVVGGRVDIVSRNPASPNPIEAFEMATAFPIRDYVERKRFAVDRPVGTDDNYGNFGKHWIGHLLATELFAVHHRKHRVCSSRNTVQRTGR